GGGGWPVVRGAAPLGAGVGAAVAAAGAPHSKAEAKVVVQAAGGPAAVNPLLPDVRELATSSLLAGNVDSTLRLPGSPEALRKRLHATIASGSQVVVLGVSDSDGDRARQIAQESAVVLTQLVQARFHTPRLTATVLDPAHVVATHGRHFLLDALIGAAVGLAVSAGVLAARRRGIVPPRTPRAGELAERGGELSERTARVPRREGGWGRRAGQPAQREKPGASRGRPPASDPPPAAPEPPPVVPVAQPAEPIAPPAAVRN